MPDAVLFGVSTICKRIGRSIGVWTAYLHNFVPLILSLLLAATVHAETLTGRVVRVADGDTITVLDAGKEQHRIRLSGIDAPEKKQVFGKRSKQNLSRLVLDKAVLVRYEKRDEGGRLVGKVMVASPDACPNASQACPKTLDAGLAQITVGLAWWYRYYAAEQSEEDRHRYEFAETEARLRNTGLWVDKDPTPPWEWRWRQKQENFQEYRWIPKDSNTRKKKGARASKSKPADSRSTAAMR